MDARTAVMVLKVQLKRTARSDPDAAPHHRTLGHKLPAMGCSGMSHYTRLAHSTAAVPVPPTRHFTILHRFEGLGCQIVSVQVYVE